MSTSGTKLRGHAYLDQDHCLSTHGNSVLSFSLQPPNTSFLQAWTREVDEIAARTDGPIAVIIVIDSQARAPDDPAKKAIQQTVLRHGRRICALAYAIEGEGFAAAAVRSALSLISLVARYPFPQKVFKTPTEAAIWALGKMPEEAARGLGVKGVTSTIEAMRGAVKRRLAAVG